MSELVIRRQKVGPLRYREFIVSKDREQLRIPFAVLGFFVWLALVCFDYFAQKFDNAKTKNL